MSAVAQELFESLDASRSTLVIEVLEAVASICALAEASDANEETADDESQAVLKAANAAVGAAIQSLGPQAVLAVLPIEIQVFPLCLFTGHSS